jgi:predicted alpha/beta superfamily hydrolase
MDVEELGRTTILGSRSYALKSKHVDQVFQIDVAKLARRIAENEALPVVYVLDGNSAFGLATPTARLLADEGLPPVLVVGIGYRFDEGRSLGAQFFETRTRDYTPSADRPWLEMSKETLAKNGLSVNTVTGGAAAFLAFIEEELKPFIASRYAVKADDQTLTGMSLGGLFTLYALFEKPGSFARYGAFSPSLWWNDCSLFRNEEALAARVKDLPVQLFLSVGVLEEGAGPPYQMVSNLETLRRTLLRRKYPGLRLTHHVFTDETHASVYPASFSRAMRVLFSS